VIRKKTKRIYRREEFDCDDTEVVKLVLVCKIIIVVDDSVVVTNTVAFINVGNALFLSKLNELLLNVVIFIICNTFKVIR
jgi:hypothetical protein